MTKDFTIERKIIIGLITSTEYSKQIQPIWNTQFIESNTAKIISTWCFEYFDKYKKAPWKDIEGIFLQKSKSNKFSDEFIEDVEDILEGLSEEYVGEEINIDYLIDQTQEYFNERNLLLYSSQIQGLVNSTELLEAEKLALNYKPIAKTIGNWMELSDESILDKIEQAFTYSKKPLIQLPGALGEFMNDQLVRDSLVGFMATEKKGKTFWLIELAMRACKKKKKVAFFEAGDLSDKQLLKRICIYLTKKSDKLKYSGKMLEPVKDCILNQTDSCDLEERECDFGIFKNMKRSEVTLDELKKLYVENKDYKPCHNCKKFLLSKYGTPWMKEVDTGNPLTSKEAQQAVNDFFIKYNRQFKISSHPSGSLTLKQAYSILDIWESQEGFVPDVIIFDYPDIMTDEQEKESRHKQNKIWMEMRGLSEKKHCLVILVTQTDADSYNKDLLKMSNFSEDKRKYGHVTAMYGLNQDHDGREKELGIIRINEIVVREGDFSNKRQVYILQNLKRGRPFLTSYW